MSAAAAAAVVPVIKSGCPVSAAFSAPHGRHPLQLLQDRASELSGVTFEQAMEIDDVNIATKIGEYVMMQLSERFHKRVLADPDDWFRGLFSGREDFPQDQSDFLLQRLGGPSYFADRKGNGALIERHAKFEMSPRTAERWLEHMHASLAETDELKPSQRSAMMLYFRHTAYFLVASQEAMRDMQKARPLTDDAPEDAEPPAFSKVWATEPGQLKPIMSVPGASTGSVDAREDEEFDLSSVDDGDSV